MMSIEHSEYAKAASNKGNECQPSPLPVVDFQVRTVETKVRGHDIEDSKPFDIIESEGEVRNIGQYRIKQDQCANQQGVLTFRDMLD